MILGGPCSRLQLGFGGKYCSPSLPSHPEAPQSWSFIEILESSKHTKERYQDSVSKRLQQNLIQRWLWKIDRRLSHGYVGKYGMRSV